MNDAPAVDQAGTGNAFQFRLLDVVFLVGMAGMGMALSAGPVRHFRISGEIAGWRAPFWRGLLGWYTMVLPAVTPLTLGLPVYACIRYGRNAMAAMGFSACAAASAALLIELVSAFVMIVQVDHEPSWPISKWVEPAQHVGFGVLGAWTVMRLTGGSLRVGGWWEQVARGVASLWAVAALAGIGVVLIEQHQYLIRWMGQLIGQ